MAETSLPRRRPLWRRILFWALIMLAYLLSTVPVGLFIYTLKSDVFRFDTFRRTGFHGYLRCLQQEAAKVELPALVPVAPAAATGGGMNR